VRERLEFVWLERIEDAIEAALEPGRERAAPRRASA
jgi:hypothetical protein